MMTENSQTTVPLLVHEGEIEKRTISINITQNEWRSVLENVAVASGSGVEKKIFHGVDKLLEELGFAHRQAFQYAIVERIIQNRQHDTFSAGSTLEWMKILGRYPISLTLLGKLLRSVGLHQRSDEIVQGLATILPQSIVNAVATKSDSPDDLEEFLTKCKDECLKLITLNFDLLHDFIPALHACPEYFWGQRDTLSAMQSILHRLDKSQHAQVLKAVLEFALRQLSNDSKPDTLGSQNLKMNLKIPRAEIVGFIREVLHTHRPVAACFMADYFDKFEDRVTSMRIIDSIQNLDRPLGGADLDLLIVCAPRAANSYNEQDLKRFISFLSRVTIQNGVQISDKIFMNKIQHASTSSIIEYTTRARNEELLCLLTMACFQEGSSEGDYHTLLLQLRNLFRSTRGYHGKSCVAKGLLCVADIIMQRGLGKMVADVFFASLGDIDICEIVDDASLCRKLFASFLLASGALLQLISKDVASLPPEAICSVIETGVLEQDANYEKRKALVRETFFLLKTQIPYRVPSRLAVLHCLLPGLNSEEREDALSLLSPTVTSLGIVSDKEFGSRIRWHILTPTTEEFQIENLPVGDFVGLVLLWKCYVYCRACVNDIRLIDSPDCIELAQENMKPQSQNSHIASDSNPEKNALRHSNVHYFRHAILCSVTFVSYFKMLTKNGQALTSLQWKLVRALSERVQKILLLEDIATDLESGKFIKGRVHFAVLVIGFCETPFIVWMLEMLADNSGRKYETPASCSADINPRFHAFLYSILIYLQRGKTEQNEIAGLNMPKSALMLSVLRWLVMKTCQSALTRSIWLDCGCGTCAKFIKQEHLLMAYLYKNTADADRVIHDTIIEVENCLSIPTSYGLFAHRARLSRNNSKAAETFYGMALLCSASQTEAELNTTAQIFCYCMNSKAFRRQQVAEPWLLAQCFFNKNCFDRAATECTMENWYQNKLQHICKAFSRMVVISRLKRKSDSFHFLIRVCCVSVINDLTSKFCFETVQTFPYLFAQLDFLRTTSKALSAQFRESARSDPVMEDVSALCEVSWVYAAIRLLEASRQRINQFVFSGNATDQSTFTNTVEKKDDRIENNFRESLEEFLSLCRSTVFDTSPSIWLGRGTVFFDHRTCETILYCWTIVVETLESRLLVTDRSENCDVIERHAVTKCLEKIKGAPDYRSLNASLKRLLCEGVYTQDVASVEMRLTSKNRSVRQKTSN